MAVHQVRIGLAAGAALGLAACGGGGGGAAFIPAPPVTPPPPTCASPPCLSQVAIFPTLKTSTDLAVTGIGASAIDSPLTASGFAVHYDAGTGDYTMTLPSVGTGVFTQNLANSPSDKLWAGQITDGAGNVVAYANVWKPSGPALGLTYTTFVEYGQLYQGKPAGVAAFGIATPASAIPVTGVASYAGQVRGITLDGAGGIDGTASFQFNFGAGTFGGHMDASYVDFGGLGEVFNLGRYDFVNTVYSAGSPAFSGELANASIPQHGTFTGQFTGPGAEELMARWSAPFHNPVSNRDSTMFGVIVGKH